MTAKGQVQWIPSEETAVESKHNRMMRGLGVSVRSDLVWGVDPISWYHARLCNLRDGARVSVSVSVSVKECIAQSGGRLCCA